VLLVLVLLLVLLPQKLLHLQALLWCAHGAAVHRCCLQEMLLPGCAGVWRQWGMLHQECCGLWLGRPPVEQLEMLRALRELNHVHSCCCCCCVAHPRWGLPAPNHHQTPRQHHCPALLPPSPLLLLLLHLSRAPQHQSRCLLLEASASRCKLLACGTLSQLAG
jgi:hypothetical protein